jgi:hypothetical protein
VLQGDADADDGQGKADIAGNEEGRQRSCAVVGGGCGDCDRQSAAEDAAAYRASECASGQYASRQRAPKPTAEHD